MDKIKELAYKLDWYLDSIPPLQRISLILSGGLIVAFCIIMLVKLWFMLILTLGSGL